MEKFLELREAIELGETFEDDEQIPWKCLNCGYEYYGKSAIDECPVCKHPRKHFTKL